MTADTRTRSRADLEQRRYAVLVTKTSGAIVEFQRYADRREAELVAARLNELGAIARVSRVASARRGAR